MGACSSLSAKKGSPNITPAASLSPLPLPPSSKCDISVDVGRVPKETKLKTSSLRDFRSEKQYRSGKTETTSVEILRRSNPAPISQRQSIDATQLISSLDFAYNKDNRLSVTSTEGHHKDKEGEYSQLERVESTSTSDDEIDIPISIIDENSSITSDILRALSELDRALPTDSEEDICEYPTEERDASPTEITDSQFTLRHSTELDQFAENIADDIVNESLHPNHPTVDLFSLDANQPTIDFASETLEHADDGDSESINSNQEISPSDYQETFSQYHLPGANTVNDHAVDYSSDDEDSKSNRHNLKDPLNTFAAQFVDGIIKAASEEVLAESSQGFEDFDFEGGHRVIRHQQKSPPQDTREKIEDNFATHTNFSETPAEDDFDIERSSPDFPDFIDNFISEIIESEESVHNTDIAESDSSDSGGTLTEGDYPSSKDVQEENSYIDSLVEFCANMESQQSGTAAGEPQPETTGQSAPPATNPEASQAAPTQAPASVKEEAAAAAPAPANVKDAAAAPASGKVEVAAPTGAPASVNEEAAAPAGASTTESSPTPSAPKEQPKEETKTETVVEEMGKESEGAEKQKDGPAPFDFNKLKQFDILLSAESESKSPEEADLSASAEQEAKAKEMGKESEGAEKQKDEPAPFDFNKLKKFNLMLKLQKEMAIMQVRMSQMQDGMRAANHALGEIMEFSQESDK